MHLTYLISATYMVACGAFAAPIAAPNAGQGHEHKRALVTNTVFDKETVVVTKGPGGPSTIAQSTQPLEPNLSDIGFAKDFVTVTVTAGASGSTSAPPSTSSTLASSAPYLGSSFSTPSSTSYSEVPSSESSFATPSRTSSPDVPSSVSPTAPFSSFSSSSQAPSSSASPVSSSFSSSSQAPSSSASPVSSSFSSSSQVPSSSSTPVSSSFSSSSQAPSSASLSSSSASASSTGGGSGTSGNAGSSGFKGISYSPYNSDGSCKSTSDVKTDLEKLTGYPIIRLYGTDCDQVANVLQGKSDSQKLFLGIFHVNSISDGVKTIADAVNRYGSWDDVVTVSIGNELVNDGEAIPEQIGQYVQEGRSALRSAGYTGDVVSVDTFIAVINNPALCQHSDYMAVNAHAFFDKYTPASKAGSWLLQQIQRVSEACNNEKKVIVTESGWPSRGDTYGVAVPSKENQRTALDDISKECGDDTYIFTAYNDLWKSDGEYGVEKWFGIFD